MKTVFVINPAAGKKAGNDNLKSKIEIAARNKNADFEIYTTKLVGDAERFVRDYPCDATELCFVACGGDGTLSEVVTGSIDRKDCLIAVLPIGTGNDFCRNFCQNEIEEIFDGHTVDCDAIKCTMINGDTKKVLYCANMINIGFDCNAADLCSRMKTKPLISGTLAYVLSVLVMLIRKKGADVSIDADGNLHRGRLLLATFANGCFCGGGFRSNPYASVTDGLINVNIIKNVTRRKFIFLLPSYKNGTFVSKKGIEKILTAGSYKKISVKSLKGQLKVCIDGEIHYGTEMTFEVMPSAFTFVGKRK